MSVMPGKLRGAFGHFLILLLATCHQMTGGICLLSQMITAVV